ncbi:MAG: FAD-binding oxidoreductase [Paracoccus sp. (in: a-proteobacteria)]|uniref:NAD(P)/FAD-dependent oxidoreductase n=1 Tax=Paracoccus sp. TaxID=267 RepID=UPI0026E09A49|nr:FAD-binding oxidoreductase [Paracoccus sp. (in: a-proteobacteria)]MDO5622287.1 FAD-binding oxidoreductase [Paracoccus sp. (in: a-proteobacteria)]
MARVQVVGGGIFGLACAWELTRRGVPVVLHEAAAIGVGSSGGTVGALAPHAPEQWTETKQIQLDALIAAENWWAQVAQAGGTDPGYARTGRLQPLPDQAAVDRAKARIKGAETLWPDGFGMQLLDQPGPLPCTSPTGLWLFDNLTARLSPRRAGAALLAALRAKSAEIRLGSAPDPDALHGPAIWATGVAGLDRLSQDTGKTAGNGVKGQSATLRLPGVDLRNAPQIYADGLHIVSHADGGIGVGSTSERDFTNLSTDQALEDVIARARILCPRLQHAQIETRWAGVRPRARSRAPMVGPWPGRAGHYIANGGFKIGFAMAPACAAMLADLLLDGHDRIPDGFRPPA